MADPTETELIGVTFPVQWLKKIDKLLKPMQNRQDFIRDAVDEKLEKLRKEAQT